MHRVDANEWISLGEETINKLRLNSPPDGWFPVLQVLSWCIFEYSLPCVDLFLSPHSKKIFINATQSWGNTGVPPSILPTLASTISAFPTSSLQSLLIGAAIFPGRILQIRPPLSFCVVDRHLRSAAPPSHCRTRHRTIRFGFPASVPGASVALRLATPLVLCPSSSRPSGN